MFAARRHRVVLAAGVVALALTVGVTVGVRQASVAKVERAKAAERIEQLREFTASIVQPGSADSRRRRIQDALHHLDNVSQQSAGDPALMREVAEAYEKLAAAQGEVTRAGDVSVAGESTGDTAGARASYEKAISIREEIVSSGHNDPADTQALADAYTALSELYIISGSPEKAAEYTQKAIPIAESLLGSNPTPHVRLLCAKAYRSIARSLIPRAGTKGDTRGALAYLRGALKMQQALVAEFPQNLSYQQGLIATHAALAEVYSAMGERDEELEQNRHAIRVARTLLAAQPDDPLCRRELATQLGNTGTVLLQLGDNAQALEHFREAFAIYDSLAAAAPHDTGIRAEWAVAKRNVDVATSAP